MDELVTRFGSLEHLLVEISWESTSPRGSAATATRGGLRVLLSGLPVWFGEDTEAGFEWTWVELLEHLSNGWPYLVLEDGLPFGLPTGSPSRIDAEAERLLEQMPFWEREDAADKFESFLEVHDLSRGVQGAVLPALVIARVGRHAVLTADAAQARAPVETILAVLEQMGQAIRERLEMVSDDRAGMAVKGWDKRSDISQLDRIAIATGLDEPRLKAVEAGRPREEIWELGDTNFDVNELLAAARLAEALEADAIRDILDSIRVVPAKYSAELETVSLAAVALIEGSESSAPFDEGYELARWLRAYLDVEVFEPVDPELIVTTWDLYLEDIDVAAPEIDAIACWGPHHGPAVLVNVSGRHSQGIAGRRATIAHEIAHLLVDRSGALPLAEVLGGRSAPNAEARARAFAAELLLPRDVAGEAFTGRGDPYHIMDELRKQFGVSAEVVAWQARNSPVQVPDGTRAFLRMHVSRPWHY